jgi:hypothetical protein
MLQIGHKSFFLCIILHPFMGCKFCLYSLFYTLSWDASFVFTHYFTPFHGTQVLSLLIILHPFMGCKFCRYSLFYTLRWTRNFFFSHHFIPLIYYSSLYKLRYIIRNVLSEDFIRCTFSFYVTW